MIHILHFAFRHFDIVSDHFTDKLIKGRRRLPSQLGLCLARISQQQIDFGRTKVARINLDNDLLRITRVHTHFIHSTRRSLPLHFGTNLRKGLFHKLPHRVRFSRRQHVIIGFILLQHAPHAFDVVLGVTPVAFGVEVAQKEALLRATVNRRHGGRNLARHKGTAPAGRLVIEQNAIGQVHAVGFAVIDQNPVGVLFGDSVGRAGVEGGGLGLGYFADFAVEFTGGGLVKADLVFHARGANRIEHAQDAETVAVGRVFGHVKGDLDVTHGSQVVYFGGFDSADDADQVCGVAEIAVVQKELDARLVTVLVQVLNTARVETRRATNYAMNLKRV